MRIHELHVEEEGALLCGKLAEDLARAAIQCRRQQIFAAFETLEALRVAPLG